jgi:hypothetical protein
MGGCLNVREIRCSWFAFAPTLYPNQHCYHLRERTVARPNFAWLHSRLAKQKIGVLRVVSDELARDRTDNVHFKIVLASPLEGGFCQRGS